MHDIFSFLESLARNDQGASGDYEAAVSALEADDSEKQALLARDAGRLAELLGGRIEMACLILQPEDEPARKDDDDSEEEQAPPVKEA